MNTQNKYKGMIYISLSALISSAATPVTAKLIQTGNEHLINGHNPISFCNVLFVGNLIALITLYLLYFKENRSFKMKSISRRNWFWMTLSAFTSGVLTPTLYFLGIMNTDVVNVVIISTFQIPLTLFFGWLFLNEKPLPKVLIGSLFTLIGLITIAVLQKWVFSSDTAPRVLTSATQTQGALNSFLKSHHYSGEICVLLAVLSSTISGLIGFHTSKIIPLGILNLFRMGLGVVFFFYIALAMFGWGHFSDIFSEFLWGWMLIYGGIIVAFNTYFKFLGLKYAKIDEISISSTLIPIFSLFFSYQIMNNLPNKSQLIGTILIIIGLFIGLIGKLESTKKSKIPDKPPCYPGI